MHEVSEHGIAAHWHYKDGKSDQPSPVEIKAQEWVKNLLEIQQSAGNSLDFLENVKIDLFPDVIYVFTPKGDIITLPKGATAIDFAYAVHSNLGHATAGCRIDKKLVPLRTVLESGQTVEIIKGKEAQPNPNWLNFVTTAKARSQIRDFLKHQEKDSAEALGIRLLSKALRQYNMSYEGLDEILRESILEILNLESWEGLMQEVGMGKRVAALVAKQIHDLVLGSDDKVPPAHLTSTAPLAISGTEGVAINFAQCCHPIPGDDIIGFISSEKGLVIHRACCTNVKNYQKQPDKWLEVQWEPNIEQTFAVDLEVEVQNKRGALAMVANRIADAQTDIESVRSEDKDDSYSVMHFVIRVKNRKHLADVIRRLKQLSIVEKITRHSC